MKNRLEQLRKERGIRQEELAAAVAQVVETAGTQGFILGADCTLPTEIPTQRIRWVMEALRAL